MTVEAAGLIAVGIFVSITGACAAGITEYGMTVVAAAAVGVAEHLATVVAVVVTVVLEVVMLPEVVPQAMLALAVIVAFAAAVVVH